MIRYSENVFQSPPWEDSKERALPTCLKRAELRVAAYEDRWRPLGIYLKLENPIGRGEEPGEIGIY